MRILNDCSSPNPRRSVLHTGLVIAAVALGLSQCRPAYAENKAVSATKTISVGRSQAPESSASAALEASDDTEALIAQANKLLMEGVASSPVRINANSKGNFELAAPETALSTSTAQAAIVLLDRVLEKHPNRLDVWVGKAKVYQLMQDSTGCVATLKESYRQTSSGVDAQWIKGARLPLPYDEFFPQVLHGYVSQWLGLDTDLGNKTAEEIAVFTHQSFPKDNRSVNTLAVFASRKGDYASGYKWLKTAYELDRNDSLVVMNLAMMAARLEKKEESKKWLQEAAKFRTEIGGEAKSNLEGFDKWYKANSGPDRR